MRKCLVFTVALAACMAGCVSTSLEPAPSRRTPEQAAARDALKRFAGSAKVDYLPVAPNSLLGGKLPEVPGCKLEFISRADLVAQHGGKRNAPVITAVTVQPAAPGGSFTVLVALEAAALEGFEEFPAGIGCEYVYRPTADGVEFVREQGWEE